MLSRMSMKMAGVCGSAFIAAAAPMMSMAQDTNSQISDRWRFIPTSPQEPTLLNPEQRSFGNYPVNKSPVMVLERDFRLSRDEKLSVRVEGQKNEGGSNLQDIIKSGTLPFADHTADGGGKMGLKVKKGLLLTYKREF